MPVYTYTDFLARHTCIEVLNDEHGISAFAWNRMQSLLEKIGAKDVLESIQAQDDRYFLRSEVAHELAAVHCEVKHQ